MSQKTEAQTHVVVKVKCPHCGVVGRIDMSRLNRSFTCSQCKQTFYVDVKETRKGVRKEEQELDHASLNLKLDHPSWIDQAWNRIPRPMKLAVPSAIGLFGLGWLISAWLLPVAELPVSLEERAVFITRAVLANDSKPVQRVAVDASFVDCAEWVKESRPPGWPLLTATNETEYSFSHKIMTNQRQKDPAKSGCVAIASIVVSVKSATIKAEEGKPFYTFWKKKTDDSDWLFDVKRTRAQAVK